VNETTGTTAADAPAQTQDGTGSGDAASTAQSAQVQPSPPAPDSPGFTERARMRRRARFLRRARELAYRDLGGLVFDLHRYGQRNDELVLAKLTTLSQIDAQLRALEAALAERRPVTVLREAGITACARCAAIHSSVDNFCPNCGLPVERNVDLPIAGAASQGAPAPVPQSAGPPTASWPAVQPGPAQPPQPTASWPAAQPQASVSEQSAPETGAPREQSMPTGARPVPTPTEQAPAASPAGGRSPVPPSRQNAEESTEILRPPAGR
jgi:hypothetical protein